MMKKGHLVAASLLAITFGGAALATPLQQATAQAAFAGSQVQNTSADPTVPAIASQSNSSSLGSAEVSFGQMSTAASLNSFGGTNLNVAFGQGRLEDGFTLSTPGVSAAFLLVDVSFAAEFTMQRITANPLFNGRFVDFLGFLQACDAGGGNCVTSAFASHSVQWSSTGLSGTSFSRIGGGTNINQFLPGQFIPDFNFQTVAAIRVDSDVPFELQATAFCRVATGGDSFGTCTADNAFTWHGIAGVVDLDGNAITNWQLTSLSGLNYGSGLPLVPGVAQGPDYAPLPPPPIGGVPEPASWAMLIAGFGLVGAMQRRRKTAVAA